MNKKRNIRWGDIYYCDLGHMKGSVQCGRRPVIVVQTNRLNSTSPTVVVAVITSVIKKANMNSHISIGKECGLKEESMIMLEQLRTIDKLDELEDFIGYVDDRETIDSIHRGLKYLFGLPKKPKPRRTGMVLSLCPCCREEFMGVKENIVRRVDPFQREKELCDKCQVRYGYDYMILKKQSHFNQGRDS